MSSEDVMMRLVRILEEVLERLKRLEEKLSGIPLSGEEAVLVQKLISLYYLPIGVAVEAARRVIGVVSQFRLDPISAEIVNILSVCREMNVSEITRAVRSVRGKASRRIVRERLHKLEGLGAVARVGGGQRPRYVLKSCLEER